MEEVVTLAQQCFQENKTESKAMAGVLQNLLAPLELLVKINALLEAPTLWGTTAFIAKDVIRLGSIVGALEAEFKPRSEAIKAVVDAQNKSASIPNTNDKIIQVLFHVLSHVRTFGPEMDKLKEAWKSAGVPVIPRSGGLELKSMDSLMAMLKEDARVGESMERDGEKSDLLTHGGALSLRKI